MIVGNGMCCSFSGAKTFLCNDFPVICIDANTTSSSRVERKQQSDGVGDVENCGG